MTREPCHTPWKFQYDRKTVKRARSLAVGHALHAYKCPSCHWWHLTSLGPSEQRAMRAAHDRMMARGG